jgi:hypothetical protein
MTERERQIAAAYNTFGKVRRKPVRELAGEVVNVVLTALGQPGLTGEEWRLLLAHVDCGWERMAGSEAVQPDPAPVDAFDELPNATMQTAGAAIVPAGTAAGVTGQDGRQGRCSLFD